MPSSPATLWPKASLVHLVQLLARSGHTGFLSMTLWEATGDRQSGRREEGPGQLVVGKEDVSRLRAGEEGHRAEAGESSG